MITISVEVQVSARVVTFLLLVISHGIQFLGKIFLLINVVVDPESNNY
jgi:hypothetical protein